MISPHRILHALGPAVARPAATEILRSAAGVAAGLMVTALLARATAGPGPVGTLIAAPLGASAFLAFAVPNSPLAQPWSLVVGNALSALCALLTLQFTADPWLALPVATCVAVLAMMLARAMHPPGAAVALGVALLAGSEARPHGLGWALFPVATDSIVLVCAAIAWNRLTGRRYPFRQPAEQGIHGTRDPAPERRLSLTPDALADLLRRMNMAANIGAEDLARVIAAAEAEAAASHIGTRTAAELMSRDLVTVGPDDSRDRLADRFRQHRFKTLPVVDAEGRLLGLVNEHALATDTDAAARAHDLAETVRTVRPDTGLGPIIVLLEDGHQQAVPVTDADHRLVGLVTRSDLIGALAHVIGAREAA